VVVLFAVHLEHDIVVLGGLQEFLSEIEAYSLVDFICNKDLFKVGDVIIPIRIGFHREPLRIELIQVHLSRMPSDSHLY